jgi:hypothetical protein
MNRQTLTFPLLVTALLATSIASVCDAAERANVADERARLVLSEPPKEDSAEVLTVFKQLAAEKNRPGGQKTIDVVVVGQIGGMPNVWPDTHPNFPWYPGQASFFIVDNKVAKQFAQHAKHHGGQDNCTFCQQLAAKNVNAIAVVNLVNAEGQTLPIDVRKVVDLKEKQTVTLRGKAKLLAGSLLQIDADGIYLSEPTTANRTSRSSTK